MSGEAAPSPELQALIDALDRAVEPKERQAAWNALVAYQRERGVRAQPRGADEAPPGGKR